MAKIEGKLIDLFISTDAGVTFKRVICSTDLKIGASKDVNTVSTKCGTKKSYGSPSYTITGSLQLDDAPLTSQVSGDGLQTIFDNETPIAVKAAHISDATVYYRTWSVGAITSYDENANVSDNASADFTIEVDGSPDVTAP